MIDKYLTADIVDNEVLSADIQESQEVQADMPEFIAIGGSGGEDGFSPIVSLTKEGKVSNLEITDKNGVHKTEILDGADGEDGFSPIVSVTDIEGGHRVSITDKDGANTFDVMDGKDGQGGGGVTSWNDLEDRPFYEYNYEDVVYLDEGLTISVPSIYVSFNRSLTVGATYKIEINGTYSILSSTVRYQTTATAVTSNLFGNFSDSGWSSADFVGSMYITFPFNSALGTLLNCTIRIAEMVTEVKVLDEKYMPTSVVLESELESKGYQTEAQVTELINNALGVIENGTY